MSTQFDCLRDAGRAGLSAPLQNRFCLKSKPLGEKDNAKAEQPRIAGYASESKIRFKPVLGCSVSSSNFYA
jgi:hypothetical protein